MQLYDRPRAVRRSAIFYIVLFILVFVGMGYFFFSDRGKFFDLLPYFCIPSAVINLVLLIFYFVKRNVSGYIFTFFFLIFVAGLIISSFKGPFAIASTADENYMNKNYSQAAKQYEELLAKYPSSKYANTALEKLPYSHYLASDYSNAVFYLGEAIEEGVIDPDRLEIKTIFSNCHMQIAKELAKNGNTRDAISNYLKSIEYLKEIENDFPDSNDAFIAKYKIPEYLLNTASLYRQALLLDDAIRVLNRIIDDYPDSEYYLKAYDMLFGTYISIAMEYKEESNYKESIKNFLKIYELPTEITDAKKYETDTFFKYFLADAPADDVIKAANELFLQERYLESMVAYNYVMKNYPDREQEIAEYTVKAKIFLLNNIEYESINASETVGSFAKSGTAKITFDNRTDYGLILYIGGPQYNILRLGQKERLEFELLQGNYEIVAEFDAAGIDLHYGEFTYEEGKKYREIFIIEDTASGQ